MINTPEAYKQIVQSKLGFHVVDVINNEVISAGNSLADGGQVLLHCRVLGNGQLAFSVKSSSQNALNMLV